MNNIYAEADEILRTSNKKQIVSIILSMQGNYLRAREAEDRLAEARAEIERLKHIERCLREEFLLNTQNYPKEYHALFQRKFKAALSAAERGE